MKKIVIVTYSYWDFDQDKVRVGGLETYLYDLIGFVNDSLNYDCIVYQSTNRSDFSVKNLGKTRIVPFYFPKISRKSYQILFDEAFRIHGDSDAIYIVATDQMNVCSRAKNVIAIQHGISWDIPYAMIHGFWGRNSLLKKINKYIRCYVNSRRYRNTRNLVCVDYNYFNWLRTLENIDARHNVVVIPNYSSSVISEKELEDKLARNDSSCRILFARRFVDYRGTLLFAAVAKRLLEEFPSLHITFAGAGPLEDDIRALAEAYDNIHITSYESKDSIRFHYDYDIAVVPTIYSEGTSLSLCEAMAAGCLPVTTHVGGMTNILIDGFNGFFSPISEDELYSTIRKAILLPRAEREEMIRNAFQVVRSGFSKKKWELSWKKLLMNF